MAVVYFRGRRSEAIEIVANVVASLSGHRRSQVAEGVFVSVGMAALTDIKQDFVTKARGGVGADGTKWPRLSPKTLAYSRRFGPGEQSGLKKQAGLGRGNSKAPGGKSGLLNAAQLKRWRQIYGTRLARFAMSMDLAAAKAKAAAIAWATLKREGAKTKLEVFGNRPHEILRDTGILANSLSVGEMVGSTYARPNVEGGDQQIFSLLDNGVIVGTNVLYAATHHYGDSKRGIPARPIVPRDGAVPQAWQQGWAAVAMQALSDGLQRSLAIGGSA